MKRNDRSRIWEFISNNIIGLSTVAAGIGVLIWQAMVAPAQLDPVSTAILGLLCLLATSEIVENRRRLDRIQATVDEEIARMLSVLPTGQIKRFCDSDSALIYLSTRIRDCQVSVDFASLDMIRSRAKAAQDKLLKARSDSIKSGKARHRYLFQVNERRANLAKEWLVHSVPGKFFTAGFGGFLRTIPMVNIIILDGEEVFTRSPYQVGEEEIYMSIRQTDIVAFFTQWFNQLWNSATRIDPALPHDQQAAEIDRLLSTCK